MLIREGVLIKGNHLLMVILCIKTVTVFYLWHCKQAQCIRLPSEIMCVELREEPADKLKIPVCCLVISKDMRLLASLELSTLTLKGNLLPFAFCILWNTNLMLYKSLDVKNLVKKKNWNVVMDLELALFLFLLLCIVLRKLIIHGFLEFEATSQPMV